MGVACLIRAVFVGFDQAPIFFQLSGLRAKFQRTDFPSFFSGVLSMVLTITVIQPENSTLALAIRLELLLLFR